VFPAELKARRTAPREIQKLSLDSLKCEPDVVRGRVRAATTSGRRVAAIPAAMSSLGLRQSHDWS